MGVINPGDVLEVQHVLFAKVEANGAISISIGDVRAEDAIDGNVPFFQTPGIVSMFATPDAGRSAGEVVVWKTGGADVAVAGRDVRGMQIAGNLAMGEMCAYAPGAQGCTMYKRDGTVSTMTTSDNTADGTSIFTNLGPEGIRWSTPWGSLRFDATGFHVLLTSGARLDLGAIGGLPAPLDAISSYASMSAGAVTLEGATVSTNNGDSSAQAAALRAYIVALQTATATAIAAAGGAALGTPAAAAFATAMSAPLAALLAAFPTL